MPSLKMTQNKTIIKAILHTISMRISKTASSTMPRACRIRRRSWAKYPCNKSKKRRIALILMVSRKLRILEAFSMTRILKTFNWSINKIWKITQWRILKGSGSFSSSIRNQMNPLRIKKPKDKMAKRSTVREWSLIFLTKLEISNWLKRKRLWWVQRSWMIPNRLPSTINLRRRKLSNKVLNFMSIQRNISKIKSD